MSVCVCVCVRMSVVCSLCVGDLGGDAEREREWGGEVKYEW